MAEVITAKAKCQTCGKEWLARNAIAVGAKHARSTGHWVLCEQVLNHSYNKPEAPEVLTLLEYPGSSTAHE